MPLSIPDLKATDVGREVIYGDGHGRIEVGRITSWNKQFVFVRYIEQVKPVRRARHGSTSEATNPADLEFCV